MKRILVDMDGVLADVYSRFFDLHEKESGKRIVIQNIIGLKEEDAFPNLLNWVNTPGFFRVMPVMADSQRILKRLNSKYEIIVISMATEFPISLTDKQLWLEEHYPYISWKQVVFCGRKEIIKGDLMIDDHFKNLDHFTGDTLLFTQPHNMNITETRHRRIESWIEIEKLLLK
jgi:5'-nucleotidase